MSGQLEITAVCRRRIIIIIVVVGACAVNSALLRAATTAKQTTPGDAGLQGGDANKLLLWSCAESGGVQGFCKLPAC